MATVPSQSEERKFEATADMRNVYGKRIDKASKWFCKAPFFLLPQLLPCCLLQFLQAPPVVPAFPTFCVATRPTEFVLWYPAVAPGSMSAKMALPRNIPVPNSMTSRSAAV